MARIAEITRMTEETNIHAKINLDGTGISRLEVPIGFMKHMLSTFAHHGLFDLEIVAEGDLHVDQHHTVEDLGMVLGQCFGRALADKRGIKRVGACVYPMDETLVRAAVDISGRPYLVFNAELSGIPLVSGHDTFQTDTVHDFFQSFVTEAGITMHLDVLRGRSDHHKIEALFKAVARALRSASEIDSRAANVIPSTKGILGDPVGGTIV
jgi:imidazoleglycerol-phosphate dehydratase